jgi:hypothetical protein
MYNSSILYLSISILLVSFFACGDDNGPSGMQQCDETEDYSYTEMQPYADLCVPDFTLCNPCPPDGLCIAGTVEGSALSGGTVDTFGPHNAICTTPCETVSDCEDFDFVTVNGYNETSEQWSCKSVGGRSVCAVSVQDEGGPQDGCDEACLDTCTVGESCIDICCN